MSEHVKLRDAEMAAAHRSERREERFALPFEIEVSGINGEGSVFHATVQTRNVSRWGCGFVSPIELRKDDIVAIRVASPEEAGVAKRPTIRFQVVRVEREKDGWGVGAWKMDQDDVWGIELDKLTQPQGGEAILRKRKISSAEEAGDEDE
jgi:PilZ domain-containing protein